MVSLDCVSKSGNAAVALQVRQCPGLQVRGHEAVGLSPLEWCWNSRERRGRNRSVMTPSVATQLSRQPLSCGRIVVTSALACARCLHPERFRTLFEAQQHPSCHDKSRRLDCIAMLQPNRDCRPGSPLSYLWTGNPLFHTAIILRVSRILIV